MHKHTFWHVFQKLRHVWVSYISWYVLGGISLTCLPTFAWQWGWKHNNTEKNEAFWVKPHSCPILWQDGVFFFTKVCNFLPIVLWSVEKCELLSETTFSPYNYFMTAWCVFFYQSVYFFTNGVYHVFYHNSMFLWFF